MVKISIIVPVYNTQAYLSECLDSLLAQDFQDWEAICLNDGSTDDSLKILEKYSKKDPRFHVISTPNGGLSVARNIALKHAEGEWITFVDSDDMIAPHTLSTFLRVAEATKQKLIVSNKVGDTDTPVKKTTGRFRVCSPAFQHFIKQPRIFSSAWNKLYHRSLLGEDPFIPGIYFEDWPFETCLFSRISSFALISQPLYLYRRTPTSIVRSSFSVRKIDSYMTGIRFVNEQFANTPHVKLAKKRCSVAMRMCINKAWRDKEHRKELAPYLVQQTLSAHQKGYFLWRYVSVKTIIRFLIMKHYCK